MENKWQAKFFDFLDLDLVAVQPNRAIVGEEALVREVEKNPKIRSPWLSSGDAVGRDGRRFHKVNYHCIALSSVQDI